MNLFDSSISTLNVKDVALSGMTDELFCRYISTVYCENDKSILIVTASLFEANQLHDSLLNYQDNVLLFPMDDFLTSEAIATSPDLMVNRLETLNTLLNKEKQIIVTNLMGYLRFLPTPDVYKNSIFTVKIGQDYDLSKFANHLNNIGYKIGRAHV